MTGCFGRDGVWGYNDDTGGSGHMTKWFGRDEARIQKKEVGGMEV